MSKITIIGLGLIGGSIGLALKRAAVAGLEVWGFDEDGGTASRARKLGAIDEDARDLASAVTDAAIVVIATPIGRVVETVERIAGDLSTGAVVTDTASTKHRIVRDAASALPGGVGFVGGHPIAGKETSGLDSADAALFDGRAWAVTPSVHCSEEGIRAVEALVALTGAEPVLIDAEEHDSYLAAVSHLPLVVSTALFSLVYGSQGWPDLAAMTGPGFRDITRLASTSPELSRDICATNRDNLVHWIDRMIDELVRLRATIADEAQEDALLELFTRVQEARDAFLVAPPPRSPVEPGAREMVGAQMRNILLGDFLARAAERSEEQGKERR